MKETQKRIKEYREMLPDLRKRVMAAVMLLVISAVMVTSASFAWLTVSTSPEVSEVTTNVAANGNLEIALATGDGSVEPGESQIGDSSAAQSVVLANRTWGNLINLSDPSYGLDNLILRPAQLNDTALLSSPLYGAVYSKDGRIERLTSNTTYTSWVPPSDVADGYFGLPSNLGVRAVSSTKREAVGAIGTIEKMLDVAVGSNISAGNKFTGIAAKKEWMDVLAKVMGTHMTATLNYEDVYINAEIKDEELDVLIEMYNEFIEAHRLEAKAIAELLNVQLYAAYGTDTSKYRDFTDVDILGIEENDSRIVKTADPSRGLEVGDFVITTTDGSNKTIRVRGMLTFLKDYRMLTEDVVELAAIRDAAGNAKWTDSGLKDLINKLVKIDDCLVKKTADKQYKTVKALLAEFSNGISGAMTALGYKGASCDVVITNGVFKNFEQRTGGKIKISNLEVMATMYVATANMGEQTANIFANVTTSAEAPGHYDKDKGETLKLYTGASGDVGETVALDTYALAVDFWVRTNAAAGFLVLEGNVLYDEGEEKIVTGKNANGEMVNMYTITRVIHLPDAGSLNNTVTEKFTVYPVPVPENETKPMAYYSAKSDNLGEYVTLSDADVASLTDAGRTVTAADGQTYAVYNLVRTERETEVRTISLYKVETDNGDGSKTTTWYKTDGTEYTGLREGEEPSANGETITVGENTYDLYSWDESIVKEQTVSYELYRKEIDTIWYDADTFDRFPLNDGEVPVQKIETVYTIIGYEGENRVWNGEDKTFISVDSTTQGSGSCYVYYADSPEDQARSLKLLAAMNVAFIDAEGALLAEAKMDTACFYAEAGGRVTVPLKLTSGVVIDENEDTGEIIYGITALQKNVATRITALVYLDGTLLGNQDVLAAADIQGRLNIQFGNSENLHPIDNEDLENDELRISAAVDKTSFDYDTHQGEMRVKTTVSVNGDAPNIMTGFFLRKVSSTQGSREEEMTFVKQPNGTWTAEYVFDTPGEYILGSVRMDGIDYDLDNIPTVTVTGFSVASLTCAQAEGNHIGIMTAANSSSVELRLKFVTNDPAKMPRSVQGRFLREDGTAVNVNFVYNPTTQIWSGTGTFLSSGDYTLEYLVLDGKHAELSEGMQYTAAVTLGMRVAVYTTSPLSFKYLESQMANNEKLLGMQVKILDNADKPKEGLQGVRLTYHLKGSGVAKMDTDLVWDAGSGYYIGELKTLEAGSAGTWVFGNVTVGNNTLTNDTTSPVFELISPEPPSFIGLSDGRDSTEVAQMSADYVFAPNGDAKLNADIKHSATASVVAVIVDANGNEYEVEGKLSSTDSNNISTWYFTIPTNSGGSYMGKQDGIWTMREIRIWNYYESDGTFIRAEKEADGSLKADGERDEPMVITEAQIMAQANNLPYETKVVQTVNLLFSKDNESLEFKGTFLQSFAFEGIKFSISDFEGKALKVPVDGISLLYGYDGKSDEFGGYTGDVVTAAKEGTPINVSFTTADGIIYTQSEAQTIQYAGNYYPTEFKISIGGIEKQYVSTGEWLASIPSFTVRTEVPAVTIASITPSGSHKSVDSAKNEVTVTSKIEGNKVTIYPEATAGCGGDIATQPQVVLKLSNMGKASDVKLIFATDNDDKTVRLYTAAGTGRTEAYQWSADGNATRWVGYFAGGCSSSQYAGTLTSESRLVLTDQNKNTYEVAIDPIIIVNKQP